MAKDKMYKTMSYALLDDDKTTYYFVSIAKMCACSHVYNYVVAYTVHVFSDMPHRVWCTGETVNSKV